MAEGQAATQPSVDEVAVNVAKGILSSEGVVFEEEKPRDEKGKFTKAQPEPEAEVKEPEQPEETAEETTEEPAQPEIRKHKLRVKTETGDDEELEVDDEELKRGYMKSKDYSAKTAAVARERESIAAKVKEAIEAKHKELEEKLQVAEQVLVQTMVPEFQNIDWNKLARENPAEWAAKRQMYDDYASKLARIQSDRRNLMENQQKEMAEKARKQAAEAVDVLRTDIQDWSDDLYGKILKSGVKLYGFKTEEVNAITDPRAIKVLHDAMKYRELTAKPTADKRVPAPVPKVIKPGAAQKTDSGDKFKDSMAKLQKSGHTNDAMEVAKLILARESARK